MGDSGIDMNCKSAVDSGIDEELTKLLTSDLHSQEGSYYQLKSSTVVARYVCFIQRFTSQVSETSRADHESSSLQRHYLNGNVCMYCMLLLIDVYMALDIEDGCVINWLNSGFVYISWNSATSESEWLPYLIKIVCGSTDSILAV